MTARKLDRFLNIVSHFAANGGVGKLVFSKAKKQAIPSDALSEYLPDDALPERITARSARKDGAYLLAFESRLGGGKVRHFRLAADDCREVLEAISELYMQINFITPTGTAEYRVSAKGAENLRVSPELSGGEAAVAPTAIPDGLDRQKNRILSGNEPFLVGLGIADASGRIHDKKQAKFRQINRFLEFVGEIYDALPASGDLVVYDLCCGKSYLSFAVYHYLTAVRGRCLSMLCIDLKRDVVEECDALAEKLGFDGMNFVCSDINAYFYTEKPHLVLSLHACDVATDIVLARAAKLDADVILSTPCCHRSINDCISGDFMTFVTSYPFLKVKLCETVTDAIRLARLRMWGYSVSASELVTTEDTPKNTIITARRRAGFDSASGEAIALRREYRELLRSVCGENSERYAALTGTESEVRDE